MTGQTRDRTDMGQHRHGKGQTRDRTDTGQERYRQEKHQTLQTQDRTDMEEDKYGTGQRDKQTNRIDTGQDKHRQDRHGQQGHQGSTRKRLATTHQGKVAQKLIKVQSNG